MPNPANEFLDRVIAHRPIATSAKSSVLDCEHLFIDYLRTLKPEMIFNEILAGMADHALNFTPEWQLYNLVIAQKSGCRLMMSLYHRDSRFIYSQPFDGFIAPLGDKPLTFNVYAAPTNCDWNVFDRNISLTFVEKRTIRAGQFLKIDNKHYVYDFVFEHKTLALKFVSAVNSVQHWAFDPMTLRPIQAISANPMDAELVNIAEVLGAFRDRSSLELLESLSRHESHHVRWEAIKSLGKIDADQAFKRVVDARSDPHPHIRNAAQKTLARKHSV